MIDPTGPIPVYLQVADVVAARIASGELAEHRPIPSELAMVQEFGVARKTARRAVAHLRDKGLVYTVQGRGTYVGSAPPER